MLLPVHPDLPPVRVGRAAPLPPDERRQAILRAVQSVVLAKGVAVTTRDLAEAAGVAEGTLFRVFEDKVSLVREAAFAAADPAQMVPMIAAIDLAQPLPQRLGRVLEASMARVERVSAWMSLLHETGRRDEAAGERRPGGPGPHLGPKSDGWHQRQEESARAVRRELTRILEPDQDRLRLPLDEAVELFETLLFGATMRAANAFRSGGTPTLRTAVLVDMFLHGVLAPGTAPK